MKQQYETQWEQCLDIIRDNLVGNEEAYNAYFAHNKVLSFTNGKLVMQIPSHFVYERLESEYFDLLKKTLQRVYGPITLGYQIEVAQNDSVKAEAQERNETKKEADFDSHLNPYCRFQTFCQGKSNELALSAALTVAQKPGNNAFNPFFIFGASGVGKTHLAQAIGLYVQEHQPEKRVLYVPAHLFKIQYTDAVRNNQHNDFINFYRSIDVLIVDDIQEFAGKNLVATQNTFFHIFNYLHTAGKQLIMTCDRPPVELAEDLIPRLLTRFKWGFIGEIEHPDYDLRKNILLGKCEKEGLQIDADVIDYIAHNATDNVRDLEGIINSLLAHSIAFNRPIDQELASRVMRMIVKIEQKVITCEAILQAVVSTFGIDMKSINSKSRKREIVLARQAAMSLCKKYTTQSVSRIGQVVGNRDHATVLHALKNVEDLLDTDAEFKEKFETAEQKIAASK
ncbi:MAG: chromosomal replication initiator protein DnaA [Bacteroidales bacterium]|nr:chromosomal replication initiator protein DnaA [Candidatus Liminaster caballi]